MKDLINAYSNTSYNIFTPEIKITIGQRSAELDGLVERHRCTEWAFITAWNPFSRILSTEENNKREKQLREEVRQYPHFEGEGVGTDPEWKPERSLLILGISEKDALRLGEKFQQNAIVVGGLREVARLVLLEDVNDRGHLL